MPLAVVRESVFDNEVALPPCRPAVELGSTMYTCKLMAETDNLDRPLPQLDRSLAEWYTTALASWALGE